MPNDSDPAGTPPVIYVYLVMTSQGTERRFEEVEAPDIETAATIGGGIVVAMRGVAYRPPT